MHKIIQIGSFEIGKKLPFALIAGPCVIEKEETVFAIAERIKEAAEPFKKPFIFKASYDKANRTSIKSFRGIGIKKGLDILKKVRREFNVPVLTDVHSVDEIKQAAEVVDVLQIPAFLCRQTDILVAAGETGKPVNVKKGQFLAPWDMKAAVEKIESTGNTNILLTERGATFGYNNLVVDYKSLKIMSDLGYPVVFDASHSVQLPGGLGSASGGQSEFVPLLARCAIAAGCSAIFLETHINPKEALSDGPNMLPIDKLPGLLDQLVRIDDAIKLKEK